MDRPACVELPAFGLQLIRRGRPEWRGLPAALVSEENPGGVILAVCERARGLGVLPGLRYGAALSLAPALRAAALPRFKIDEGVRAVTACLGGFSPEVEPSADEPGTFWVNADGLERLYPSIRQWGLTIQKSLLAEGFAAAVAVGFSRFGTYALAKVGRGVLVVETPAEEARLAREIPLSRLSLPPAVRQGLAKLGKQRVGDLLALPAGELLERFGVEAHRLHRRAAGNLFSPLKPAVEKEVIAEHLELSGPVGDAAALTFYLKRMLTPLLARTAAAHERLAGLTLSLRLDRGGAVTETLRPAAPTLDESRLVDLARLFLENHSLGDGVVEIDLKAHNVPAVSEQLSLFLSRPRRDLAAAERAFARLRAAYGKEAVVVATLKEAHLPEARFAFAPLHRFRFPEAPAKEADLQLVRRIFAKPVRLEPRPVCGPRGCHLDGLDSEPVSRLHGPCVISGGWWVRAVEREYHFAETEKGHIAWIYFDRRRHAWFVQGEVE